ncbi:MAG: S9 family peptidase [Lysobacteraceae bacterium]|nr:MAG: S9 family peptidase [Xanthomonadaceae bacterium]
MRPIRLVFALCACIASPVAAFAADVPAAPPTGRVSENIPSIPDTLAARLQRYANTRSAGLGGWLADGSGLLVTTRLGNTVQVHRVRAPGGAREQLTFYDEPVSFVAANPVRAGFVFGRDAGGSEFWQLYWYDLATHEVRLLTDGTSRNADPLWSSDGRLLAYTSNERNGTDTDVWVLDLDSGKRRAVVTRGGAWAPTDFSPDGTQLLVEQGVSVNEVYPGVVRLADDRLRMLPVDGGKAAFGSIRFGKDAKSAWFNSDEGSEFLVLRHHDFASGTLEKVSDAVAWDAELFALSRDRTRVAYVTNEDGISVLRVLDAASRRALPLPTLPVGVIDSLEFSPDGRRLAFSINAATSPSDVYTLDLGADRTARLERWTESEVGGLDRSAFVTPGLVRFPSFDEVDGKPRAIPAFYYRPAASTPGKKLPVVINIHGGPEGQARPLFSADTQFLVNELGIAVLVPNVRGSAGYGKTWLKLDNGRLREDSVRDIGALLDWIATQPELDASRVAVYGGSYGGYMVLAAMTHYNDRLRAGVDIVGISNFVTFLENTQDYRRDLRRVEYGDERDPAMRAFLERISPTANAARISIPLFVAQGANDPRVPASEAAQIVKTVRGNGGDVWFLQFPDEGHGFKKKANADHFRAATMLFWQQHLIGEGDRPAGTAAQP